VLYGEKSLLKSSTTGMQTVDGCSGGKGNVKNELVPVYRKKKGESNNPGEVIPENPCRKGDTRIQRGEAAASTVTGRGEA